MKRSEATTIVIILDDVIRGRRGTTLFPKGTDGVPSNLGVLWIDEIEKIEDAAMATQAAVALFTETTDVPTPVDYRAALKKLEADARMKTPTLAEREFVREIPTWVKRWVVARAANDMRVFPEQKPGYDALQTQEPGHRTYVWPDQEPMPADAWLEEAEHVTEERVWKTLQS